jgi:hypothetical protein
MVAEDDPAIGRHEVAPVAEVAPRASHGCASSASTFAGEKRTVEAVPERDTRRFAARMNHIAFTVSPRLDAIAPSEAAPRSTTAAQSTAANGRGSGFFTSITITDFPLVSFSKIALDGVFTGGVATIVVRTA